jgi:hypothetical protein
MGPITLTFHTRCSNASLVITRLMAYQPWQNMWSKNMLLYLKGLNRSNMFILEVFLHASLLKMFK